jgi:transposase InsO family protein
LRPPREALDLRHARTRPYTPKTNGKAERFIKTLLADWAYAVPYRSSWSRRRQLPAGCATAITSAPMAAWPAYHPPLGSQLG